MPADASSRSSLSSCSALAVEEEPCQGQSQRAAQNQPYDNNLEHDPHFVPPDVALSPHSHSSPPSAFLPSVGAQVLPLIHGKNWSGPGRQCGARVIPVRCGAHAGRGGAIRVSRSQWRLFASMNARSDAGTSSCSTKRRRNSSAISTVTLRDQPCEVLKATMRAGFS